MSDTPRTTTQFGLLAEFDTPGGTLAGGPNSSIQDPYAQSKLLGCVGQFCYIDDIQSWSTNEEAINWNSALAWVSGFVAELE